MKELFKGLKRIFDFYKLRLTCNHKYELHSKFIGTKCGKDYILDLWYRCPTCRKEIHVPMVEGTENVHQIQPHE